MTSLRGILLMCAAVSLFTAMSAMIKAAPSIPAGQAVFFRASFSMPVILCWMLVIGQFPAALRTRNWKGHAIRGVAGTTAMGLGFAGLHYLPLPDATAIRFASPLLIVIFAAVILGERLRIVRVTAVLVGLVGVVIVLWPQMNLDASDGALWGVAFTLGSATLAALAQVFIKSMSGVERTETIVFYFTLTAMVLSLLTVPLGRALPPGHEWVWPSGMELVLLIGAGLIGGVGQIMLTASYRFADAGVVAPFTYVSMLWAVVIGFFVFAEVPTIATLGGSALIIGAGIAIVLRERQLGLARTAERKVAEKGMR